MHHFYTTENWGSTSTSRKPSVPWKRNGWFFAFVYTDALLADFVPNLIRMGMNKAERFENLRRIAQYQMQVLMEAERIKELPEGGDLPK